MLQCYVFMCVRSVIAFLAPPRSQRPGQGPRSPHPKAGPGSGDRIPVGARFSAPLQTVSDAHPASSKMGTGSLSRD
jgi:hypothetical protein